MTALEIALFEFHGAVRVGNAALDKLMTAAGALDQVRDRLDWKRVAARATTVSELLSLVNANPNPIVEKDNYFNIPGLRLLVCGSRDWTDPAVIDREIERIRPGVVIEGEAPGADLMAKAAAVSFNIPVVSFPADWDGLGKSAGPRRNLQMLKEGRPDIVLAFHDDINRPHCGTKHMIEIARDAGIPCRLINSRGQVSAYGGRVSMADIAAAPAGLNGLFGFIDVETTGLNSRTDEIIEFAIAVVRYNPDTLEVCEVVERYCEFRQPNIAIPPEVTAINNITESMVFGRSLDMAKVADMIASADFLSAHNADFDRGFTENMMGQLGKTWLCTRSNINWRAHGFRSQKLQNLLAAHDIDPGNAHRALDDVLAAVELLKQRTYFKELAGQFVARVKAVTV